MENISCKISVITICYNCKADLEGTIKSVLSQTYDNIEYIIVDGGSTDGTSDILKKYQNDISKLISEPDNGIYDALNKGVKAATGDWIICMNAGDIFVSATTLSDIFSQQIPQGKTVLYSDFLLCQPDGSTTLRTTDRSIGEIHHQNIIYRRLLHEQYGYYIITKPYIISDLLFFLAIPETQYYKLPSPIAKVKAGGISDNQWCTEQAWAAKMIYGMDTIPGIFWKFLRVRTYIFVKRLFTKYIAHE